MFESTVKHVPEWFPGAGFKKTARTWRALQETVRNKPFKMVLNQRVRRSGGDDIAFLICL